MRLSFNGNYPVSQPYGVYDPAYANYPGSVHPGTDWALPANTPLIAGMSGSVTIFNRGSAKIGRGNEVVITNSNKQRKTCHMNRIDVVNGQQVTEGQNIGLSGFTGYVVDSQGRVGTPAGAHLHDELLINGQYVDLDKYLKENDMIETPDQAAEIIRAVFDREPTQHEINDLIGRNWYEAMRAYRTSGPGQSVHAQVIDFPQLQKQVSDLQAAAQNSSDAKLKKLINDLQAELNKYK